MHVNKNNPQAKLIKVVKGKIYDVVIDLRKNSKTYKKYFVLFFQKIISMNYIFQEDLDMDIFR